MDYTPRPHLFKSMANQGMPWWKVLAELIDNSFDAGANRATITFPAKAMLISDDGSGIRDIASAVTLGYHDKQDTTSLGTYGIGLKDAWMFCGSRMEIDTTHGTTRTTLISDSRELEANNWQGAEPQREESRKQPGTEIRFSLAKAKPRAEVFEKLRWVFNPALSSGRQILYRLKGKKSKRLAQIEMPVLMDVVSDSFEVNGKHVAIEIGIVPTGKRMPYGPFWVSYGHRNILSSDIGTGDYDSMRMGGTIRLGSGWSLSKNKDDLTDYVDELAAAIHERIKVILQKAHMLSDDIQSDALRVGIEDALNSSLKGANRKKESRKKPQEPVSGTIEPAGTGRRRRKSEKVNEGDGSVVANKPKGKITFKWEDKEDENHVGTYDSLTKTVRLNINHPFVADSKADGNTAALRAISVALISEYTAKNSDEGNKLLNFQVQDFPQAFGTILKTTKGDFSNGKKEAG